MDNCLWQIWTTAGLRKVLEKVQENPHTLQVDEGRRMRELMCKSISIIAHLLILPEFLCYLSKLRKSSVTVHNKHFGQLLFKVFYR